MLESGMPLESWLGSAGLALSIAMAIAIAVASRKPGARPPYLAAVFAESSAFFLSVLCARIPGGAYAGAALAYCGSLIGLPSLYLFERSVTGEAIRRPVFHYLAFLVNLPLGLLAARASASEGTAWVTFSYYAALTLAQTVQLAAYGRSALRLARAYGGRPNWLARISVAVIAGYGAIVAMGWILLGVATAEEFLGWDIAIGPVIDPLAMLDVLFLAWTVGLCLLWGGDRASAPREEALRYGGRDFPEAEALGLVRRARAVLAAEPDLASESVQPRALAMRLGVPYYALSRAVNEREGLSLLDLANEYRVERAKAILAGHPEAGILEACYESGFSAKSTFNEVFRRSVGMSPSEYRKSLERPGASGPGRARPSSEARSG